MYDFFFLLKYIPFTFYCSSTTDIVLITICAIHGFISPISVIIEPQAPLKQRAVCSYLSISFQQAFSINSYRSWV